MPSTETRSRLQGATWDRTRLRSNLPARSIRSDAAVPQLSSSITFPKPRLDVAEARLDSWKAIASYLDREVRTVQRWEKTEQLPVHRHYHSKHGSVYAFSREIDEWRESRRVPSHRAVVEPPSGQSNVVCQAHDDSCRTIVMEENSRLVREAPCAVFILW